ncbi:MAG: hypothetical protein ABIY37_01460 [Devosia sp.]
MKLDLTVAPMLVITGTWNVPIFSPPWLANHLFGYEIGSEAPLVQLTMVGAEVARTIAYMRNLGFHVEPNRIDLFANKIDEAYLTRLEALAARLLTVLPHTPIGSLGVNFRFIEEQAGNDLVHKLDTAEDFAGHYQVLSLQAKTRVAVDDLFACQVTRDLTETGDLIFDFNYHSDKFGERVDRVERIAGILKARLDHAKELLHAIYGLDEIELVAHDFADQMGPNWE